MSVDRRIVYGLTLITLSLVAVQVKVVTLEAVASLVLGTMTVVAALLASPPGQGDGGSPRGGDCCPHDRCPVRRPPQDPERTEPEPVTSTSPAARSVGSKKPPASTAPAGGSTVDRE